MRRQVVHKGTSATPPLVQPLAQAGLRLLIELPV